MPETADRSWNHPRYWAATVVLCALLIFSGVLVLRNASSASQISGELHVPEYLGVWVLPVVQLLAAAIILWRKLPTVRVFAYAWVLYYFAVELMLLINAGDFPLAAFAGFKIIVWVLAFWWDRDRIAKTAAAATLVSTK
jgi:hypothetical protein